MLKKLKKDIRYYAQKGAIVISELDVCYIFKKEKLSE